jgi:hypothetical protein
MATYFAHPSHAESIEKLGGASTYWLTVFFGPFYLAAKRAYGAALLHAACAGVAGYFIVGGLTDFPYDRGQLALAILIVWDFILAAAFFDTPVGAYRRRGWREVGERPQGVKDFGGPSPRLGS